MRTLTLLSLLFALPLAPHAARAQTASSVKPKARLHTTPAQKSQATHQAHQAQATQSRSRNGEAAPPAGKPVILDSVVAVINGDVLLQSDVESERRFASLQLLPPDQSTDAATARRLITQTLVLQQMKEQGQDTPDIPKAQVDKLIGELRAQQPGCRPHRCDTAAGWRAYLAAHHLTPEQVAAHWKQRLAILDYLSLRFQTGMRISTAEQRAYYQKTLIPQFQARHVQAPSFKSLRPRIEHILVEQKATTQIDDWEKTLQTEGSVEILVPAYGQSNQHAEQDDLTPGGL